jgi:Tfp pilus assembly protein PilF
MFSLDTANSIAIQAVLLTSVAAAETWFPLNERGTLLQQQGHCRQALPVFSQARSAAIQELGPKHPSVAVPTNNLGSSYFCLDELTRAERYFRESLALLEDYPRDPIGILNNLGVLLMRLSHSQEAEEMLEQALALSEELFGSHHRDAAAAATSLGTLWLHTGEYARARDMLRRALEIWEIAVGPDHIFAASALNNLGVAHLYLGDYERAKELMEKTLEWRRRLLPPRHPDIGVTLYNYAVSLKKLGQGKLARSAFREAASIRNAHARKNALGVTVDIRLLQEK